MNPIALDWDADTDTPISLALVKQQLRISHSEFDELIEMVHIPGAVSWAESIMKRSILSKTHRWIIDTFPSGAIHLPRGKTQSVSSIAYVENGTTSYLRGPSSGSPIGSDYQESLSNDFGGILIPPQYGAWPSVDNDVIAPVTITFTAGWPITQVPADIKLALMMYVSDALEIPGAVDLGPHTNLESKDILLSSWSIRTW